jgi:Calpain family cysteine protease
MPIRFNDSRIKSLYANLEAQRRTDPNVKIGDRQVLEILGAVADSSSKSFNKAMTELQKPGVTRAEQVELIKKGMSANEKADLAKILDSGTVPLEPAAKNFIEAVLDRAPVNPGAALQITGDQRNGIAGLARPGASIEAINVTTAPGGRLHIDDTMEIARADSSGRFSGGRLPEIKDGDQIRLRARYADGTTSDWVTVKANMGGTDTRNAVVALFRVGLSDAGNGKIGVVNINESRQISEPGAKLQFTNARTNEKTVITLDDNGTFPANLKLNGKTGDTFSVAATDGTNNTSFSTEVGKVTVGGGAPSGGDKVPDPALHKDELNSDGTPRFGKKEFTGPLFKGGIEPADVFQGQIGDCYFPSAMAALALNHADEIEKMIKSNGDGTYTVTFKEKDWMSGRFKDVPIKVDGDLYVRSWGGPLYGASGRDRGETSMELWFPLIEKAYAAWKGSYNEIGSGGLSNDVFEAVLGKDGRFNSVSPGTEDRTWRAITTAIDARQPVSAGTHGDDQAAIYTNTGVYADHSYSVLGYAERNGEKFVKLRNPWGESEPAGNGPNDGVFELPLKDFTKLYSSVMYTN